jgi:hypothetical protein
MIYGFDTRSQEAALGALIVYGLYRSRDVKKFKVKPDMWTTISNAVGGCALRSVDLWEFIEKMKPKMHVGTLNPRWMAVDHDPVISMYVDPETGELIEKGGQQLGERRQFWVDVLDSANHEAVLYLLANRTSYIIALVRDRLEREKPYEAIIAKEEEKYDE